MASEIDQRMVISQCPFLELSDFLFAMAVSKPLRTRSRKRKRTNHLVSRGAKLLTLLPTLTMDSSSGPCLLR